MTTSRVLVLGASGMLGSALFRFFSHSPGVMAIGACRSSLVLRHFPPDMHSNLIVGLNIDELDSVVQLLANVRPDVVINCIGVVKQVAESSDPLVAVPINSLFPHRLARLCDLAGSRLVHISTDCVFSGRKGMYTESDTLDAQDVYGRSKALGEVDYLHAITLRTSIIGHEMTGARSLISWFLAQEGEVLGFRKAIFSGLPTVEMARVIRDHVLPHPELHGIYHVSAEPISKLELLRLVAGVYEKRIRIVPEEKTVIDRSLDSTRFRDATGFDPKPWEKLVEAMHDFG